MKILLFAGLHGEQSADMPAKTRSRPKMVLTGTFKPLR